MTEILTESFCERCGTRYTFESDAPKDRLRRVKVLSRGLKTFVLDDKTSLDEALAAARSDTDREATSSQLDAFHKTFNFCMQCRQYTCPDCWNEAEGHCLTCAPLAHHVAPSPFPDLQPTTGSPMTPPMAPVPSNGSAPFAATNGSGPAIGAAAAAASGYAPDDAVDGFDPIARLDALSRSAAPFAAPVTEPTAEPMVDLADAAPTPEPVLEAIAVEPAPEVVEEVVVEPEVVVEAIATEPFVAEPMVEAVIAEPAAVEPVIETAPAEPAVEVVAAGPVIEPLDELVFEPVDEHILIPAGEPIEEVVLDLSPAPTSLESAQTPVAAESPEGEPASEASDERAAAAAAATGALFAGLRPGQSIDDAIDAYERDEPAAEVADEAEPEPMAVVEPEPEPAPEPEPIAAAPEPEPVIVATPEPEVVTAEPVIAVELEPAIAPEPAPEPEPIAAAPEPEPEATPVIAVEPAPAVAATPPAVDVVEQPTWTIMAPEAAPASAPVVVPPVVVPPAADPQWPATPEWPAQQASPGLPFLNRPAVPTGGVEALWAASDREVTTAPVGDRPVAAVQSCVSCGLSLSATARFCRRCGTAQH